MTRALSVLSVNVVCLFMAALGMFVTDNKLAVIEGEAGVRRIIKQYSQ